MSRPLVGLFRKEWQQHRNSVIGVAVIYFALCASFFILVTCNDLHVDPFFYFATAFYLAIIHTWGISGSIYAIELEKNTFPFLRNLPVSPLTIAVGKIGFVMITSALVLVANLLCYAVFAFLAGYVPFRHLQQVHEFKEILSFLSIFIVEVFIWGIFWSTRSRHSAFAVLAAAACPILTLAILLFAVDLIAPGITDPLTAILPVRLALIAIVGVFAIIGALRWFEFSIKDTRQTWIPRNFVFARYPQNVQPPFPALIHQHLRHVSLVYPVGVACFIIFSLACLPASFLPLEELASSLPPKERDILEFLVAIGFFAVATGIFIFWGNIFGHDQRNGSYRFLGRIGIHESNVWWSRMLPATLLYLPTLPCFLLYLFMDIGWDEELIFQAQLAFTIWLTFLATGAFGSISCEKQVTGIGLTALLSYFLAVWMFFFLLSFGGFPLWTTVPIALAFLVASRIRARYWLREIATWRSRLIPLLPVFATVLLVLIALPFVRVYSVPYVSSEQMDSYLDAADATPFYEEFSKELTKNYAGRREFARMVFSGQILAGMSTHDPEYAGYFIIRLMPWEELRRERILRLEIVASLVDSGVIKDARAVSMGTYYNRWIRRSYRTRTLGPGPGGVWDDFWRGGDMVIEPPSKETLTEPQT